MHVWVGLDTFEHVFEEAEVNVKHVPLLLSTLSFETEPLIESSAFKLAHYGCQHVPGIASEFPRLGSQMCTVHTSFLRLLYNYIINPFLFLSPTLPFTPPCTLSNS